MKKKGMWNKLAQICALTLPLMATVPDADTQRREAMMMPVVEEDSIMKHIIELSSERYEGRLAGTVGYDRATDYVKRTLKR